MPGHERSYRYPRRPVTPSIEVAVLGLAGAQLLVPMLKGLLERRQAKHEAAADQVPLLVQKLDNVATDVRAIKDELRQVSEHTTALEVLRRDVDELRAERTTTRERLHELAGTLHALSTQVVAQKLHAAINAVAPQDSGRATP